MHVPFSVLLPHADQFAFLRLFKYLTFRSGGAVLTALFIAFWIGPVLIRWLKTEAGQGPAHPQPTARSATSSRRRARRRWAAC